MAGSAKSQYLTTFLNVCIEQQECRDPRGVRYPSGLLVLGLTLSECAGMQAQRSKSIWLRENWKWIVRYWLKVSTRKPNSKGTPSQSCLSRFLAVLDSKNFGNTMASSERNALLKEWEKYKKYEKKRIKKRKKANDLIKQRSKKYPQYCLDGKARKGCISKKTGRTEIDLTLYCPETYQVLALRTLKDKEGEQTAALTILRKEAKTMPRGVLSGDSAMLSPNFTYLAVKAGHSYILCMKGNAGNVFKKIKAFDWENVSEEYVSEDDISHGRQETRLIKQVKTADIGKDYFDKYDSAAKVYQVTAYVYHIKQDKWTEHTRYFLGDEKIARWSLCTILTYIRDHWKQESYHWSKDVTLNEDNSCAKGKNGSRILGILRSYVVKAGKRIFSSTQRFIDEFSSNPKKTARKMDMS